MFSCGRSSFAVTLKRIAVCMMESLGMSVVFLCFTFHGIWFNCLVV